MFREFEWRGDDAATSSGSESGEPGGVRVKMAPAAEEAALVRAAAKDEKDAGADMHWADAIKLLQAGQLNPRPSHIMDLHQTIIITLRWQLSSKAMAVSS